MTASIPASELVQVTPSVIVPGGSPLQLNAVFLTNSIPVPIGTVMPFSNLAAVQAFFGPTSQEALMAAVYFAGFDGSTALPDTLYFAQYNTNPQNAYLRGGTVAGMTLAQLQLLSGTLTIVIDGVSTTSLSINLAGATSFSNAAALIQTGVQGGTPSTAATVSYDAQRQAFLITSPTTGPSSTIGFANVGTLATGLKLTQAAGAVTSQGAAIATPETTMASVVANTMNWATFTTTFEPSLQDMLAFAVWVNSQNKRFLYVAWDTDATAQQFNQSGTFGAQVKAAAYNGVAAIWVRTVADATKAALICAITAAIDFLATNGRTTYAYRGQAGLIADVTDATIADNLLGNGYNFYGSYATANQMFTFLQDGKVSGSFVWLDAYVNQIRLNSQFQLAFLLLLQQLKSVPYNGDGTDLIRAAAMDPINEGLNFGSIRAGIQLSAQQAAAVNAAAGLRISDTLMQVGWYLDIDTADGNTRLLRGSPPITFFYTDGGSIQRIDLASINVL